MRSPSYVHSVRDFDRLISLGSTPESSVLEFKADLGGWGTEKLDQREFARDVAQFANSQGGCLMLGVVEGERDGIKVAMTVNPLNDADKRREWMTEAIRRWLVPYTISYDIDLIEHPAGTMLVVNVEPARDLVAVWDGNRSIEYPYRTEHGKKYMNPDEAERHRMNTARAGKIALQRAFEACREPASGGVKVALGPTILRRFETKTVTGTFYAANDPVRCGILLPDSRIEEEQFWLNVDVDQGPRPVIAIPYGLVREAWKAGPGEIGLYLHVQLWLHEGTIVMG